MTSAKTVHPYRPSRRARAVPVPIKTHAAKAAPASHRGASQRTLPPHADPDDLRTAAHAVHPESPLRFGREDRRLLNPSGRITLDTRVIIAKFFDLICGDDHPCITRSVAGRRSRASRSRVPGSSAGVQISHPVCRADVCRGLPRSADGLLWTRAVGHVGARPCVRWVCRRGIAGASRWPVHSGRTAPGWLIWHVCAVGRLGFGRQSGRTTPKPRTVSLRSTWPGARRSATRLRQSSSSWARRLVRASGPWRRAALSRRALS